METDNICQKYSLLNEFWESSYKSLQIVKSNLMLRIKRLAEDQGSEIDTGLICCKWCFNTWIPGKYSVSLKPEKHPRKHMRSLLKKDVNTLNKFQQKLVAKIKKSTKANTLVLLCLLCFKNTHILLQKENVNMKDKEKHFAVGSLQLPKKKKKKKDIFAGLNPQAVQQFKKSTEHETSKKIKPNKLFSKKAIKEISFKQQLLIHRALLKTPVTKKKPSQLAMFLENM